MFGKKKGNAMVNFVDDSRSIARDFLLRMGGDYGYESYRPADYPLYHELDESEMIPKLDAHLNKLFTGEVDDANGDVLDSLIFGAYREGNAYLDRKQCDNLDVIRRLSFRRKADYEDIRNIRSQRVHELEAMQVESDNICRLLSQCEEV